MQLLNNASRYDWSTWFVGIMRSFIAGGGGAVAAPLGPMIQDAKDYNLGPSGLSHVLISMGIAFLVTGIVALGVFLQTHGAPDKVPPSGDNK